MRDRPNDGGYRLIIFDWDGTLLDSVGSIVACTQATLDELGLPPVPEGTIRSVLGLGLRETVETFCPGCDDDLFERVLQTYRGQWNRSYRNRPALFAGIEAALAELAAAGHLLAVATAKSRGGLERELADNGLAGQFAATRTMDEAPGKPHPKMLLDILEELGVDARQALMVGDTTHDLRMAVNAGVDPLAVCSGSHPRAELLALAPLACLDSAAELPVWLAGVPA